MSRIRSVLPACAFSAMLVVAACDSSVKVPGGLKELSIAMTRAEVDAIPDQEHGTSTDPEALYIQASNIELTCGTFGFATASCATQWVAVFEIAPAMQEPGVYPIGDLAGSSISSRLGEGSDCPSATVDFVSGTFEVLEIDDAHIRYRVTTDPVTFAEGEHTAARCP